jgi:hypothetical protein
VRGRTAKVAVSLPDELYRALESARDGEIALASALGLLSSDDDW